MGKTTGFMDYDRQETPVRDARERVGDWEEFHGSLSPKARQEQGGRCMNCGVPYCQTGIEFMGGTFGCPLHNLIPEWNDMVYSGNTGHALSRLMKTNNFPEFTGRVCPAPCEQVCINGRYGDSPVTVRENELSIIEEGFAAGRILPRFAPTRSGKKVCIVGSGPAGLAAADQLNHRGHSVTVVEREAEPGGLLMYGIPSMKLSKKIIRRRIDLMKEEGVEFITGTDASKKRQAQRILKEYDAVILCCGAEVPRTIAAQTEGITGFWYGTEFLKSAVERQELKNEETAVPSAQGKRVVIIGTGDTASDCVATALRQGCRSVLQLVRRKREDYLVAGMLPVDYAQEEAAAVLGQDPRKFSTEVQELVADEKGNLKEIVTSDGERVACDMLLAATGFSGCREDVCHAFGVQMEKTVKTAKNSYATNVAKVFSAGDMRRGQSLVVWAIAEGRSAAAEVDEFLIGYTNLVRPQ